jgi:uncharacterized protein
VPDLLRLNVADCLRRAGTRRDVNLVAPVPELRSATAAVEGEITVTGHVDGITEGIVATVVISGSYSAECSRCLAPITHEFTFPVREFFEQRPIEGETYPLVDDEIDLALIVRDTVLPELPVVPLCRPECLGLCSICGVDRNETTCECRAAEPDPRWEALGSLTFTDS